LSESLCYIDYTKEIFVKEAFLIMYYSKGGLNLTMLENMDLSYFHLFLKEAERIQELHSQQIEEL